MAKKELPQTLAECRREHEKHGPQEFARFPKTTMPDHEVVYVFMRSWMSEGKVHVLYRYYKTEDGWACQKLVEQGTADNCIEQFTSSLTVDGILNHTLK